MPKVKIVNDIPKMEDKGVEAFYALEDCIVELERVVVGLPLVWLWVWDNIKEKVNYYRGDNDDYYSIKENITNLEIFSYLWRDCNEVGFSLEYGSDQLDEDIEKWLKQVGIMIENKGV